MNRVHNRGGVFANVGNDEFFRWFASVGERHGTEFLQYT